MKSFKEYMEEEINESLIGGLSAVVLGLFGIAGAAVSAPIAIPLAVAITTGGAIEALTASLIDDEGVVTREVKKSIEDYKNKKFAKNITEEQAEKIIADVKKKKESLTGGKKGAITKLENELALAFKNGDEKKVGKILKNFIEKAKSE